MNASPEARVASANPANEAGRFATDLPASAPDATGHASTKAGALCLVDRACGVCGDVEAEPLAIGQDFDYHTSADTFLALQCTQCGSMFVSPAPARHEQQHLYPYGYHPTFDLTGPRAALRRWRENRRLARWCKDLAPGARILDIRCGGSLHLELDREEWRLENVGLNREEYDAALLIRTLEHVEDPAATLRGARSLLRPGGIVLVVSNNIASPSFGLFQGRHWGGYDFPRQRYLFSETGLRRLAEKAGLEISWRCTTTDARVWLRSVHRMLSDWSAPRWLRNRFRAESLVALTFFAAIEGVQQLRGRGALSVAVLRRLQESAGSDASCRRAPGAECKP